MLTKEMKDNCIAVYEQAGRYVFSMLHPELGYKDNPFGKYGLDLQVYNEGKLYSIEEHKTNFTREHNSYEEVGQGILIELKKFKELKDKTNNINSKGRKKAVGGVYRRFFKDAEVALVVNGLTENELKPYYKGEYCEVNQFTTEKENQMGYYIPLYAKRSNGDYFWKVRLYTAFEAKLIGMVIEQRDNVLNRIKNKNNEG